METVSRNFLDLMKFFDSLAENSRSRKKEGAGENERETSQPFDTGRTKERRSYAELLRVITKSFQIFPGTKAEN